MNSMSVGKAAGAENLRMNEISLILIALSDYPMYTILILFLILFFGYPYCKKETFDNNYRHNAISIEQISD